MRALKKPPERKPKLQNLLKNEQSVRGWRTD